MNEETSDVQQVIKFNNHINNMKIRLDADPNRERYYAVLSKPGYCWLKLVKQEHRLFAALAVGAYPNVPTLIAFLTGRHVSALDYLPRPEYTAWCVEAGQKYLCQFVGHKYMHIEFGETTDMTLDQVIYYLAQHVNYHVGGVHDDVLKVADMQQDLYLPAAQEYVRAKLDSARRVSVPLNEKEEKILKKYTGFDLVFTPKPGARCDHPVLAAMRELTRQDLDGIIKSARDTKTLFVGATMREVYKWHQNKAFHFHVPAAEGKDTNRVYVAAFDKLSKDLTSAGEVVREFQDTDELHLVYHQSQDLLDDVGLLLGNEGHLHTELVGSYSRVVAEDSIIYHYTWADYYSLFEKTGATELLVTGILPVELTGHKVLPNELYSVKIEGLVNQTATLMYKNGTSNGYTHKRREWGTLLDSPAYNGTNFNLVAEEICRVGPQVLIRVQRTYKSDSVVRRFVLSQKELVEYLDFKQSSSPMGGKIAKWVYKVGVREEFYDALNYCYSIDPKSVSVTTIAAHIRRRFGGASLINRELAPAWELEDQDLLTMAVTIYVQWFLDTEAVSNFTETQWTSCLERLKAAFRIWAYAATAVFWETIRWLFKNRYQTHIVMKIDSYVDQKVVLTSKAETSNALVVNVKPTPEPYSAGEETCPTCALFKDHLGAQKMICSGEGPKIVEFGLTQSELDALYASLADDDNDPSGLKKVKEDAKKALPKTPFSRRVKVSNIVGGPGTGKSTLCRGVLTADDGVYAPFSKLKSDYTRTDAGESITFKTLHRGFVMGAKRRLFVDEYTAIPYEYLAAVVFLCGAEEVFLIGDQKQTGTRLSEGIPIKHKLDLSKGHVLFYNFRNNDATVDWLVDKEGYIMGKNPIASKSGPMYQFARSSVEETVQKLCFGKATKEEVNADLTVRQSQGSTFANMELFVPAKDLPMLAVPELKIVAATRCQSTFTIICDELIESEIKRLFEVVDHHPEKLHTPKTVKSLVNKKELIRKMLARRLLEEKDRSYYTDNITTGYREEIENLAYSQLLEGNIAMVYCNGCVCVSCRYRRRDKGYHSIKPDKTAFMSLTTLREQSVVGFKYHVCSEPEDFNLPSYEEAVFEKPGELPEDAMDKDEVETVVLGAISEAMETYVPGLVRANPSVVTPDIMSFEKFFSAVDDVIDYDLIPACPSIGKGWLAMPSLNLCGIEALSLQMGVPVNNLWDSFVQHVGDKYAGDIVTSSRMWDVVELALICQLYGVNLFVFKTRIVDIQHKDLSSYTKLLEFDSFYGGYKFDNAVGTISLFHMPGHFYSSSNTPYPLAADMQLLDRKLLLGGSFVPAERNSMPSVEDVVKTLEFAEVAQTFVQDGHDVFKEVAEVKPLNTCDQYRSTYDAYMNLSEFDTFRYLTADVSRLNNLASMQKSSFTGKIIGDPLVPVNARGNLIKPKTTFSFGIGNAISFIQTDGFQELETLHSRYMCKRKKQPFDLRAKMFAFQIADSFVNNNLDVEKAKGSMAHPVLSTVMNEYKSKMVSANYLPQYGSFDSASGRHVRFHMKDIVKPRMTLAADKDIVKAGQGISAWSKESVVLFGAAFRAMTQLYKTSCKSSYVFNNGLTDQQAQEMFQSAVGKIPFPDICTFDGEAFDAGQNLFTQAIERRVWERLGVSKLLLDWYYSFREKYFLIAKQATGWVEEIKTSGENGTLINNSIISAALCDYIAVGKGPVAIFNQGDDVLKAQSAIVVDENRKANVAVYCNMKIKISVGPDTEACGYAYYYGNFVANVRRKFTKVVAHRFRGDEHFYEFQVGLRDYTKKLREGDLLKTFHINALQSKVPVEVVEEWFMALESMCHISWEQFKAVALQNTDQTYYLCRNGQQNLF